MDVVNVKVQRNNPDLKAKCALLNNLWKKVFFSVRLCGDWVGTDQLLQILALYTFQILPASKMPNFHLNKMCESLIYLLAEQHHLFLQTKHNKLSGNFKRISDNFEGEVIFLFGEKVLN